MISKRRDWCCCEPVVCTVLYTWASVVVFSFFRSPSLHMKKEEREQFLIMIRILDFLEERKRNQVSTRPFQLPANRLPDCGTRDKARFRGVLFQGPDSLPSFLLSVFHLPVTEETRTCHFFHLSLPLSSLFVLLLFGVSRCCVLFTSFPPACPLDKYEYHYKKGTRHYYQQ